MKLDHDCVRDVMLKLEELLTIEFDPNGNPCPNSISLEELCAALPHHKREDVFYTLSTLKESGYIDCFIKRSFGGTVVVCSASGITPIGHEFIERIRTDDTWSNIKRIAAKVGDFSLSAISAIAEGVAKARIASHFP